MICFKATNLYLSTKYTLNSMSNIIMDVTKATVESLCSQLQGNLHGLGEQI